MYGYEITQKVKVITKGELAITEGALYPLLHRLEADGVLQSQLETIGNRPRKYYSLSASGKKEVHKNINELKSFLHTLNLIINPKTA